MVSIPILCVNVSITIDTMLKFDANADANIEIDTQCERTFRLVHTKWKSNENRIHTAIDNVREIPHFVNPFTTALFLLFAFGANLYGWGSNTSGHWEVIL